jgi:regulator of protease activity HflC (stomatin/prohibitin superfamily)
VFNSFSGEISRTLSQGVNFLNPITDKIKYYDVKTTKAMYEMDGLSSDSQTIKLQLAVNYRLQEYKLKELYQNVKGDLAETVLYNAVYDTAKSELGKFTIDAIAKNREALKSAVEQALKARMITQYVDIQNVSIVDIDFSVEFEKSIQDKMIAEQQALQAKNMKEKTRYESEAKAIENEKLGATISPMVLKQKFIEKWDGKLPVTMTGENAMLLLNLN